MESEKFNELLRILRLMKSASNERFSAWSFVDSKELSADQRSMIEKEFGARKMRMENSLYYNYYRSDDPDF